ncbi:MAG TPA: hypothetical protein VKB86_08125 [Pyrinomonadaceae bacterium]|nr:hypothetical protein [Pyrinomonadaceae bacterium]
MCKEHDDAQMAEAYLQGWHVRSCFSNSWLTRFQLSIWLMN